MKKVVLAFSGGLDTTFCAIYLREELGYEVITVTVDTGGFSKEELERIEERAKSLGVSKHCTIDGRNYVYDRFVTYIIKGNCLRGSVYPLSVGAERVAQALEVGRIADEENAAAVAHGSTGAGNDQIRFDVALGVVRAVGEAAVDICQRDPLAQLRQGLAQDVRQPSGLDKQVLKLCVDRAPFVCRIVDAVA